MSLCLDSNVFIDLLRRRKPHYRQRLTEAGSAGVSLHLSVLVLHELALGARRSGRPEHHMEQIAELTSGMSVHDWTADDAFEAAHVRAELGGGGFPIGRVDTLLAGQARNRGWTIVTANVREFARVPGLHVVDWSNPDGPIDVNGAMARSRRPSED